jgi:ribosome-binding factor A
MTTFRIERINKELLRELTEFLRTRVKDETVRRAVLTHVDCSRDLSFARVFYTLIDPEERPLVEEALDAAKGILRGAVGRQMRIRVVPQLRFIYDETEVRARRIDELLDRIGVKPESKLSEESPENVADEEDGASEEEG